MNATDARQPIPVISQRAEMAAQIDRLEASGMPVAELRADLAALHLPDDTMLVALSHSDTIIGAAQLRTIVSVFGPRMPLESVELLERIAAALLAAEVRR